jgi:hypothetical protein
MYELLTTALAVFVVWEALITFLPVSVPAWLQPALVAGCVVGVHHLPQGLVAVLATVGAVALCHAVVHAAHPAPTVVRRRPSGRVPRV